MIIEKMFDDAQKSCLTCVKTQGQQLKFLNEF